MSYITTETAYFNTKFFDWEIAFWKSNLFSFFIGYVYSSFDYFLIGEVQIEQILSDQQENSIGGQKWRQS